MPLLPVLVASALLYLSSLWCTEKRGALGRTIGIRSRMGRTRTSSSAKLLKLGPYDALYRRRRRAASRGRWASSIATRQSASGGLRGPAETMLSAHHDDAG